MRQVIIFCLLFGTLKGQNFRQHIVRLASDSLQGRAPGTEGERGAATYIAGILKQSHCEVTEQQFEYDGAHQAINVLGFLNHGSDSTIVISAHYDHLGLGSRKSRELLRKGIHPGADDNASGVALMLEIATSIKDSTSRYNYLFAAYSAHEEGLYGSDYFSKSPLCQRLKIRAVLNFDMVGRLDTTSKMLRISGSTSDSTLQRFFTPGKANGLHFRTDDSVIPLCDLKSFAAKNLPVLNISTGIHEDYHRMSDTEEKINYQGMQQIFEMLQQLLVQL